MPANVAPVDAAELDARGSDYIEDALEYFTKMGERANAAAHEFQEGMQGKISDLETTIGFLLKENQRIAEAANDMQDKLQSKVVDLVSTFERLM
jgi:hypothetical protein